MPTFSSDNQDLWNHLHLELKTTMQKEISLLRELLANLHQEELSLMFQDQGTCNQLLEQRVGMLEHLSHIRLLQDQTKSKLFSMVGISSLNPDLNQILPDNEAISCEILSLKEQLLALHEKMNRQQFRNQHLIEHPEHLLSLHRQAEALKVQTQQKRKMMVATYQIKK